MTFPDYRWQDVLGMALIAVLYALLGKLVLSYFSTTGNVTLVWFPGGMALAILLLRGLRLWPGVIVGAFLAGLLMDDSLWLCLFIAIGNALESVIAAWWLKRDERFSVDLTRPYDLQRLTLVAVCSALISAAMGPMALWQYGFFPLSAVPGVMLHWWMADVFGIVTVTPLILIWRHWPKQWFEKSRSVETLLFLSLTLCATGVVFLDMRQLGDWRECYWMYAFMLWGALRFGRHGVQFVATVTAITALMGAAKGLGYFAHDFEKTGLWNYWLFQTLFSWVGSAMALTLHNERQAYASLAASEHRLQAMFDTSPVAYALNDDEHNITLLNPAFSRVFGYTLLDIPGLSDWWLKAYPDPAYRDWVSDTWQQRLQQSIQTGSAFQSFEVDVHCKNGEIKHVQVGASPLEGAYCGEHLVTLLDLTEQTRARRALSDSNVLLQSILETLPLRVFWKDCNLRYVGANQLFAQDAGAATVDELLGKTDYQMSWSELAARYQHDDQQIIRSGEPCLNFEEPQITPSGEKTWLRISKMPLRNSEQQIVGVLGVYEDISMRKRIEDQLMWRTAFLEALMDCSPGGILAVDANGKTLLQNQRVADLWGIPNDIADQQDDAVQLAFVKDKLKNPQEFLEKVNFLYANPDVVGRDEIELIDGVILERYSAAVRDRLGNYYGRIWHFTDVTEVRRTQQALQNKEYYQRALLDNFPFMVWLKDKDCRYLAVNQAFANSFSVTVDQVVGKTDFDIFPHALAEKYRADDLEVMLSKQQKNLEHCGGLDGERIWREAYKAPILDKQGEVLGTVGFACDITQRTIA